MRHGFTLVELSIVLVIIGLLVGGVMTGQALIHAAELSAITREESRYATAIAAFRDKYLALPGDLPNATQFWGTDANCPGLNPTEARAGIATCNGDGDKQITHMSAGGANQNEAFGAWQHLANAGLVEGRYSGVNNTAGSTLPYNGGSLGGFNVPSSKFPNAAWGIFTLGSIDVSNTSWIDGVYGTALVLGEFNTPTGLTPGCSPGSGCPLSPEDAENIDYKVDDGKAGQGSIVVSEVHNTNCYLLADGSAATVSSTVTRTDIQYYMNAPARIGCMLIFKKVM